MAIETVNDNVWVANGEYVRIYDTEGNNLLSFRAGSYDVRAIEVIPEPATLLLRAFGTVSLRKRKNLR